MKRYFLLWLLISSLGALYAQVASDSSGCVRGISTDPDNPVKSNPADPVFHENTFDWLQAFYPTRTSYNCNLEVGGIENPYYEGSDNLMAIHQDALSDFQPADGWELVKRDFGYLMQPGQMNYSTAISNGGTFKNPYLMLYNRYRGVLRIFAALPFSQPGQNIVISLTLQDDLSPIPFPGYDNVNGLFSQSTALARPLDQETAVQTLASPTAYPDICNVFFYADFHVAYDPCVCYFKSILEVTFDWVETSTFTAVGQGVGVTQDLSSALNSGYDPSEIMASFWAEDISVSGTSTRIDTLQSGTYIHARAWELYEKHMKKEEAKGNFELAGALYFLATVAKVGAVVASKGTAAPILAVSAGTAKFGAVGSASIVAATATVTSAKKFSLAKALKVAAPVFDFLSTQFKEDKAPEQPAEMMPMAIEFELALQGRIEKLAPLESKTIRIGVPGSQGVENLPEEGSFNQPAYPTYNEALGIFALLETPVVRRHVTTLNGMDGLCTGGAQYDPRFVWTHKTAYRLKEALAYAINPAANLDLEASEISVALMIKRSLDYGTNDPNGPFFQQYYQMETTLGNLKEGGNELTYLSPFLPVECLENLTAYLEQAHRYCGTNLAGVPAATDVLYLRFVNTYVSSTPGQDGRPVMTHQVLTYPVTIENASSLPVSPQLPIDLDLGGAVSGDIRAWGTINIVGPLNPTGSVTITAGEGINVLPGVSIPPGIILETGYGVVNPCSTPNLPYSRTDLDIYCVSTQYKADQLTARMARPPQAQARDSLAALPPLPSLTAFPNPFDETITLRYDLPAKATVSLVLYDMLGRPVRELLPAQAQAAGMQEHTFDTHMLPAGLYQVIMQAGAARTGVKVVRR